MAKIANRGLALWPQTNLSEIESIFKNAWDDFGNSKFFPELKSFDSIGLFDSSANFPRVDILNKKDKIVIEAQLAGYSKDQIKVWASETGDTLTIQGQAQEKRHNEEEYQHREIKRSSFSRSFLLNGVNTDKLTAEFKEGYLIIEIPKVQPDKPKIKQIEIK